MNPLNSFDRVLLSYDVVILIGVYQLPSSPAVCHAGVINVSYEKTSSGEIKVLATHKEEQPKLHPPGVTVEMTQLPKCTTGHTIHSDEVTLLTTTNGKGWKLDRVVGVKSLGMW